MSARRRKTARGLFITGTNTEVGKTYVAALIARQLYREGYRVGVYKPAASGCVAKRGKIISEDAQNLWRAAGKPGPLDHVCPQRFLAPLAPHLAAEHDGKPYDEKLLRDGLYYWLERSDIVLVEAAGGLMSPMGQELYAADLAYEFGFPLVIVTANLLGVICQTLQTVLAARAFRGGLPVAAVVLNNPLNVPQDVSRQSNFDELKKRCGVPVLTEVRFRGRCFSPPVDWAALAAPCKL